MSRWLCLAGCLLAAEASLVCGDFAGSKAWSQIPTATAPGATAIPKSSSATAASQPVVAANAASGAATQQLLKDARSLIQRHRFRSAEELLLGRLTKGSQESPELLEATLGEVYFRSGQDGKALSWLNRALTQYEQVRRPTLNVLNEESHVAGLLSDTYARQGQQAAAMATLEQMTARYDHQDLVDCPTQMDLLSHLAALRAAKSGPAQTVASLDGEMDWLAKRLQTDRDGRRIAADDYIQGMVCLAKYQNIALRYDQAVSTLTQLIERRNSARDSSDVLPLRLQLAQVYRKKGDIAAEINVLEAAAKQARELQHSPVETDSDFRVRRLYELAEVEQLLADALLRDSRLPPAAQQLASARQDYQAAWKQSRLRTAAETEAAEISDTLLLERVVDVGDRLTELQGAGNISLIDNIQMHEALLANYGQLLLPNDPRIARLNVSLAGLYLENSQFDLARTKLNRARDYWSEYRPRNIPVLVQTLNLLAESDLATASADSLHDAADVLSQAAKLCDELPPDDGLHWWVRLNLGRLKAAQGHYQQALDELGQIVADQPRRPLSPRLRSLALLQLGLLYKEQLEFEQALKLCGQALDVRQSELAADNPQRLPYYLALGELYIARNDVVQHDDQSLQDVIQHADAICGHLPEDNPNRAAVSHLHAMSHYLSDQRKSDADQRQAARAIWEQLVATCRRTGQQSVEARTLHYLARLDYLDWSAELKAWSERLRSANSGDDDAPVKDLKKRITQYNARQTRCEQARREYRQAVEAYHQLADQRYEVRQEAFQSLQDRLAAIQREQKELNDLSAALSQERENLLKAHDEAVVGRSAVQSNDRTRWRGLLEHGEKLEQQSLALLRATGIYPSLHHAALCNDAQLLQAQSQLDVEQGPLLERALAALREANQVIEDPRAATFTGDFMRAEFFSQYQSAFDLQVQFRVQAGQLAEALVAAEQGRSRTLLDQLWPNKAHHAFSAEDTARIVEQWRVSDQPLLYYYVGGASSYLFVLGGAQHEIQLFPLKAEAAAGVSSLGNSAPSSYIAEVVERLRNTFRDERSARQILENPLVTRNVATASAVLLPPPVVDYLRQELARGASSVTVIPHKAISQVPLEALLVGAEEHRGYLVDCCPPIVYAPSLAVLDDLQRRRSPPSSAPRLLTLGDPDYAASKSDGVRQASYQEAGFVALPETENECREIARSFAERFGKSNVVELTQAAASEAQFRAALKNSHFTFLHLATHGIVGVDRGQPFGRMVLTPPVSPTASKGDDGFLDLEEIRNLDLAGCELTALSACNTNLGTAVGRQDNRRVGDPGSSVARGANALRLAQTDTCFSLASAFLAAGSRRVLATQWEVADPSTRALTVSFFDKATREISAGRTANYARLLAEARKDLRTSHPEFDTPFHWAPFVLIGPAQTLAPQRN